MYLSALLSLMVLLVGEQAASGSSGTEPEIVAPYAETLRKLDSIEHQSVQPTDKDATLKLGELRDGQLTWRDKIKSLQVHFEYRFQRVFESPTDLEAKRGGTLVPSDYSFEMKFSMKGPKRFHQYSETTPSQLGGDRGSDRGGKETSAGPRTKRPGTKTVLAFNGTETRSYEPHRAVGQVLPGRASQSENLVAWYFDAIAIPTGPNAEVLKESPLFVPVALNLPEHYRVLRKLQEVDGFPCHVVSSGFDTMWIDPGHGFCVRRRVWFRRTVPNDPSPCLSWVWICKDFTEVDPGIWLPRRCYRLDYAAQDESPSVRGRLKAVNESRVKSIAVNNVDDSAFNLDFPPGTDVTDLIRNKDYVMPRGEEQLDEAIAEGKNIVNGFVEGRSSVPRKRLPVIWLSANVVILIAICIYALYRSKLRAREKD